MIDVQTGVNLALVVLFVLIGGVFAATELALVSLREGQVNQLEQRGSRGARVAGIARDPNRFLSAVQIGVTVAGFFSAAYGGSTLAPDVAPYLADLGLSDDAADTVAIVVMTLLIAYLSLVLGELVPKRLALQRSSQVALLTGPPLDRFATVMRPVIWLLSVSTNALVRLLGGDPNATSDEVSKDELRDMVSSHEGLDADERQILGDVFAATRSTLKEVMRPRGDVVFVRGAMPLAEAAHWIADQHYSRYPVIGEDFDDVTGFLHARDLLRVMAAQAAGEAPAVLTVADIQREVLHLPGTNRVLPSVATLREAGAHLAVVVDEFGGTDGIVTLEDLVEEIVGDIRDEYDAPEPGDVEAEAPGGPVLVSAGLTIEDFADATGVELPDGDYETVAGYLLARLGHVPEVDESVDVDRVLLRVTGIEGRRITQVEVVPVTPEAAEAIEEAVEGVGAVHREPETAS
ncbi:hemolysin family protein [Nocardioides sp.]|uniref:hemolysin family protein n=1 Tax=Nocardioides sp. TaxID=35761 RepID=UPI003517DB3B